MKHTTLQINGPLRSPDRKSGHYVVVSTSPGS